MSTVADFLTCEEAGLELGLTLQQVAYYVREGRIKAQRLRKGWPWMLDPQSVQDFKEERESRAKTHSVEAAA